MNIVVSGISFRTTPVEIREKLCFNDIEELKKALAGIRNIPSVNECVLLSTCNRTEVYICSEKEAFDFGLVERTLCELKGLDVCSMKKYFYAYAGQSAVKHIFKVASAMDSMIMGEDQILGQFKEALKISIEMSASSAVLNTLLRKAITASKIIKTYSMNTTDNSSIASATARLIGDIFKENLKEKNVLVIGSGKIGSMVIKQLGDAGVKKIFISYRKYKNIDIPEYVEPVEYDKRYSIMKLCDIVISSTRSPHYTITRDMLEKSMNTSGTCKVFIDLAVPRDIDPDISNIENVRYFNIDDFKYLYDVKLSGKLSDLPFIEDVISKNIEEFKKWYRIRKFFSRRNC